MKAYGLMGLWAYGLMGISKKLARMMLHSSIKNARIVDVRLVPIREEAYDLMP